MGSKTRNHNESFTAPPFSWARTSLARSDPCTYGPCDCRLPGTILNWHNGEPIGTRNNVDETGCRDACENTQDCAAWTLNTQNGWCALKAEDQIKKGANSGFVSEIRMGYHDCPNY